MNTVDMWKVLEIEPTKDENEIVNAYRSKVVTVNPEDDAEGFMLLREAFEMAINYAREDDALEGGEETSDEPEEKTEVDLHIDKAKDIYEDIFKRGDISLWEDWVKDPICIELDTSDAVREALLVFIMGHFMLPYEVWQLLDKTFNIVQDRQALQEVFPPDFISFVIFHIENESFVDFSCIEEKAGFEERHGIKLPDIKIEGKPGVFDPEKYESEVDSYLRYLGFAQAYNNNIRMYELEDGKNSVEDGMSEEEAEKTKKRVVEEAKENKQKEIDVFTCVLEYLDAVRYLATTYKNGMESLKGKTGRRADFDRQKLENDKIIAEATMEDCMRFFKSERFDVLMPDTDKKWFIKAVKAKAERTMHATRRF